MKKIYPAAAAAIILCTSGIQSAAHSQAELDLALIEAAEACNVQEAARLITEGANVNARFRYTNAALLEAAGAGCLEMVDLLLNNGADANIHYISGNALHSALRDQKKPAAALAIVNRLIKAGTDINQGGGYSKGSPLETLVVSTQRTYLNRIDNIYAFPIAFQLLIAGANKYHKDEFGRTALMTAYNIGNNDMAALLEMYPGRNLQERIIFSIAKRFYSDDPKVRALAKSQLEQLQQERFAERDPYLNRMLLLIIGRSGEMPMEPAQSQATYPAIQDLAPELRNFIRLILD